MNCLLTIQSPSRVSPTEGRTRLVLEFWNSGSRTWYTYALRLPCHKIYAFDNETNVISVWWRIRVSLWSVKQRPTGSVYRLEPRYCSALNYNHQKCSPTHDFVHYCKTFNEETPVSETPSLSMHCSETVACRLSHRVTMKFLQWVIPLMDCITLVVLSCSYLSRLLCVLVLTPYTCIYTQYAGHLIVSEYVFVGLKIKHLCSWTVHQTSISGAPNIAYLINFPQC